MLFDTAAYIAQMETYLKYALILCMDLHLIFRSDYKYGKYQVCLKTKIRNLVLGIATRPYILYWESITFNMCVCLSVCLSVVSIDSCPIKYLQC